MRILDDAETLSRIARMREKVWEFERRYEMTSENMESEFRSGRVRETAEICTWLMYLRVLERVA